MEEYHPPRTAPFYDIPSRRIISVEHPALIRNVEKAIDTLQGTAGVVKILNPPRADTPVSLVLRPEDAMSRPLQSISTPSNNILLKVTVPKRTGRKRKSRSGEPFTDDPLSTTAADGLPRPTARELLRSLRDNVGRYQVEPVGMVDRTHIFRGMPDFVFSTAQSAFTSRFREQILPFDYRKLKQFDLDMSKGAISNVDIIRPPSFSHGDIPFNYFYRQNPTVRQSVDTSGNITTVNTQQAPKVLTHLVSYDIAEVPSKFRDSCPPIETLDPVHQETVAVIQDLFNERPAWTRRGLRNSLKTLEQRYALRHAIPYVGYIFRSGPWRDAIVKFGYDPRKSPSSRIYQTAMFRLPTREAELARDGAKGSSKRHAIPRANEITPEAATSTTSHLFSGQPPLPQDGRMWMFCDVTDPLLKSILFPSDPPPEGFLRTTCDIVSDGWFGKGTLAKVKTIMRSKITTMFEDRVPDDADFARVLQLPDHASPETGLADFWLDPATASTKDLQLATEVRSNIRGTPAWKERAAALAAAATSAAAVGGQDREGGHGNEGGNVRGEEGSQFEESEEENRTESEGEEEEIEQEEILEAAADAVDRAAREKEEDDDREEIGEESGDSERDSERD